MEVVQYLCSNFTSVKLNVEWSLCLILGEKWTLRLSCVWRTIYLWLLFCTAQSSFSHCPVSPPEFRGCYTLLLGVVERTRRCWETSWLCRVILDTGGQDSWVLLLLPFFCDLCWPLCFYFFLHLVSCLYGSCKFSLKQECYFTLCSAQRGPTHSGGIWGLLCCMSWLVCIVKKAK